MIFAADDCNILHTRYISKYWRVGFFIKIYLDMVEVVSGALRALFMLSEGAFYVWTAAPNHRQELLGRFIRENIFSLKSAEYADSRFGPVMKWFMWLMLVDTDLLMQIQYGINLWSDKELLVWRENILASFATVGIAVSVRIRSRRCKGRFLFASQLQNTSFIS
jgi:hypothetical protein